MSSEKRRRRRHHGPIFIEENIIIDSKSTTITTHREEQKHTANTRRQWYPNENNTNETLSERIERVLRKINGWNNESSVTSTTYPPNPIHSQQTISVNKTNSSAYDNIPQGQSHESHLPKSTSNSFFHTLRQQCCSSNYREPTMVKNQSQPISLTSVDERVLPALTTSSSLKLKKTNSSERQEKKVRVDKSLQRSRRRTEINEHDWYPIMSIDLFFSILV